MAIITPRTVFLREPVCIRTARAADAPVLLAYLKRVAAESDNLTFEPDETSLFTNEEEFLETSAAAPNALALVAEAACGIIGNLTFHCGSRPKLSRSGEFGLTVRADRWGRGVGSTLLATLLDWAPQVGIGKIHLQVESGNSRAITLYRRFGFIDEALIRHQLRIGGTYRDLIWMGLKIGADGPLDVPVPTPVQQKLLVRTAVRIRIARPKDAQAILDCMNTVSRETEFLSMGTEGVGLSVEEERIFLANAQENPGSLYLAAFAGEQVVGTLSFAAGTRRRTRHAGEFSLAVLGEYAGMGIGRALLTRLINWASASGIHKINLEVRTENERAVNLYSRLGFVTEGRISRTVFYDGGYHDSYAMGLILN